MILVDGFPAQVSGFDVEDIAGAINPAAALLAEHRHAQGCDRRSAGASIRLTRQLGTLAVRRPDHVDVNPNPARDLRRYR
jgi:hypothetical protein